MQTIQSEIKSHGVLVCAIGNGTSLMAKDFVEQFDIQFPVYTDPKRETYSFMKFKRSFGIGFSSFVKGTKAFKKGHRQGAVQGDPWQQGGEALFSIEGTVLWSHSAKVAGVHASKEEILSTIDSFSSITTN